MRYGQGKRYDVWEISLMKNSIQVEKESDQPLIALRMLTVSLKSGKYNLRARSLDSMARAHFG
jgi:hypothetical protein